MRAVLSALLFAFTLLTTPGSCLAADTGDTEAATVPDGSPVPPPAAEDETSAEGETDTQKDIMQNFTRHRPGACPEGPPCRVED